MRRALLVLVLAIAPVAAACKHHDDAPAVVPGAPAGDVTEATGAVTATRDGKSRALAVGAVVSGDDVVKTGADGRVTIVLRHNHVPWSLGPGKEKKVGDSAAWAAAEGASGEAVTDDKSGAAGRHAERSAAETAASAGGGETTDKAAAVEPKRVEPKPDEQQLEQAKEEEKQAKAEEEERAAAERDRAQHAETHEKAAPPRKGGTKSNGCEPDDPLCGLGDTGGGGPGSGSGSSTDSGDHTVGITSDQQIEGGVDRAELLRVMKAATPKLRACYEQMKPKADGKLTLTITVGADGHPTKVLVGGADALAPMRDCARQVVLKLTFARSSAAFSFVFPIIFQAS